MMHMQEDAFQVCCLFSRQVQTVQKMIQTTEIDQKMRIALHRELETMQERIAAIACAAPKDSVARPRLQEINREIISLYKAIEDRFDTCRLACASDASGGKVAMVAEQIEKLKTDRISRLQVRKPSAAHCAIARPEINLARKMERATLTQGRHWGVQLGTIRLVQAYFTGEIARKNHTTTGCGVELALELATIADQLASSRPAEGRIRLEAIRLWLTYSQVGRLDAASHSPALMAALVREIADECLYKTGREEPVIVELHA